MSNFSIPGVTLQTGWRLSPPPTRVDLSKLEAGNDPDWTCYHTAFYADGFRRGSAYVKNFIPRKPPLPTTFVEQWVLPGWDCAPLGSCAAGEESKAGWTNELIQFAIDMSLPVQENFFPPEEGRRLPMGSIAATLGFAATQEKARAEGKPNWRELNDDGSREMISQSVHVTLVMSTEFKRKLPPEGTRWLYLRSEIKSIENARMDLQVLLFDETLELIACSSQSAQIIPAADKSQKGARM